MSNAITTRNAHVAIAARRPFKAGALKGEAHPDGTYTVHSYRAQIALYSPEHGWRAAMATWALRVVMGLFISITFR